MAGQNAFAFNGTAFVPEDRNLTAGISVFTTPTYRTGVARAYTMADGIPASQMWIGFPPMPFITEVVNDRTGAFPNLVNSIVVRWGTDESSLIGSFTIFAKIDGASFVPVATVASNVREYRYGVVNPGIQYDFYIRTNGTAGLNTSSTPSGILLTSPSPVSTLTSSKTTSTATVFWTVPAGTYQRFNVYDGGTFLATVNASLNDTSYSYTRTGLSQGATYNFRVFAVNYNNHQSTFQETNVTVNTMPVPSISWEDANADRFSNFRATWSGSTGVSYQPQYSVDDVNWNNLGGAQSGSGTKYTDYISPAVGDDQWIRIYVYDGEVAAYTNKVKVTPGQPYIPYYAWGPDSAQIYSEVVYNTPSSTTNGSFNGQEQIFWGNRSAFLLQSTTTRDTKVDSFRIKAELITAGVSLTSNLRRAVVNVANNTDRTFVFDNEGNGYEHNFGGAPYQNSDTYRVDHGLRAWGLSDQISRWDTADFRWEYSDGVGMSWKSGRVKFTLKLRWRYRDWTEYALQSRIATTY